MSAREQRAGVDLTNLDQPLSPDAGATKRDLVDYLDAVADRMLPGLAGRPLTVLRVLRGRAPFMQKNVPKYTPEWVRTVAVPDLRRQAHSAMASQSARRRIPPDVGLGRRYLPADASRA